jgi:hypothetical protein
MSEPEGAPIKEPETLFELPSAGNEFSLKSKSVFDNLLVLETKHAAHEKARAHSRLSSDEEDGALLKDDPDELQTETIKPKNPSAASARDYCEDSWQSQAKYGHKRRHDDDRDRDRDRQSGDRDRNSSHRESEDTETSRESGERGMVRHSTDRHRDQNPGFKRPFSRGSRGGRRFQSQPQFKKTPDKWTVYSLADVDASESSNSKAAFEFLHERKKLREMDDDPKADIASTACSKEAFVFRKPKANAGASSSSNLETTETELSNTDAASHASNSGVALDTDMEVSDPTLEENEGTPVIASETVSFKSRKARGQRQVRRTADEEEDEEEDEAPVIIQRNKSHSKRKHGFDPATIDD